MESSDKCYKYFELSLLEQRILFAHVYCINLVFITYLSSIHLLPNFGTADYPRRSYYHPRLSVGWTLLCKSQN